MAVHWTDDPSPTPLAALHHHSSSHDRFGIRNLHFRKLLCFLAPLICHFLQMVSCSAKAKCVNDLNCTWISVYVWFRSHETSSWSIFVRQLTRPKMIESWSILLNDSRLTIEVSRWGGLKRWHDTTNHNLFKRNSFKSCCSDKFRVSAFWIGLASDQFILNHSEELEGDLNQKYETWKQHEASRLTPNQRQRENIQHAEAEGVF